MRVIGFTFIRNAIKFDFPVQEAIRSILPLCEEVVVAVGQSDDNTRNLISRLDSSKIRIIDTVWNDKLTQDGAVLADETNKALAALDRTADWAIYIQGDEVLPEAYHAELRAQMERWKDEPRVDGLLLNYLHFFGSYHYVGDAYSWYRQEIRVIRPRADIYSYRDAQGFRKGNNEKLRVKGTQAYMYHYGWVRPPKVMLEKRKDTTQLYQGQEAKAHPMFTQEEYEYQNIDSLKPFTGQHPAVMRERINQMNWQFSWDASRNKLGAKDKLRRWVEKLTGYRLFEYKNYKKI